MRFTIVNFVYLFYTIVKGFYLSKLLRVTSSNKGTFQSEFLISKETVVLHRWGSETKIGFYQMNW